MRSWLRRIFFRKEKPGQSGTSFHPRCESLDDRALPSATLSMDLSRLGLLEVPGVNAIYVPREADLQPLFQLAEHLGFSPEAPPAEWLPPVIFFSLLSAAETSVMVVPPADPLMNLDGSEPPVVDVLLASPEGVERVPISRDDLPSVLRLVNAYDEGRDRMFPEYGERWANRVLSDIRSVLASQPAFYALLPGPPPPPPTATGVLLGLPGGDSTVGEHRPASSIGEALVPLPVLHGSAETPVEIPTTGSESFFISTPPLVDLEPGRGSECAKRTTTNVIRSVAEEPQVEPTPRQSLAVDGDSPGNLEEFEPLWGGVDVEGLVPFDIGELQKDVAGFLADLGLPAEAPGWQREFWLDLLAAAGTAAVVRYRQAMLRRNSRNRNLPTEPEVS